MRLADVVSKSIWHNHLEVGLNLMWLVIVLLNDWSTWVIQRVILMAILVVLVVLVVPMGRG